METLDLKRNRTVIPRWKSIRDTPDIEMRRIGPRRIVSGKYEYNDRVDDTLPEDLRTLVKAVTTVECGLLYGITDESRSAARYILTPSSGATDVLRRIAARINNPAEPPAAVDLSNRRQQIHSSIRRLKIVMTEYPRDALSAVELARMYTLLGQVTSASRWIDQAVKQCPDDRYVLRACASFYKHSDEPEKAYRLIRKRDGAQNDPWILSAELALGALVGRTPQWVSRQGRLLGQNKRGRLDTSELAAGLAALELNNGSIKRARILFENSMLAPTENAFAQFKWTQASGELRHMEPRAPAAVPSAFEAQAYDAFVRESPEPLVKASIDWLDFEPVSSAAALIGSAAASAYLADFDTAIEIADRGLMSSPNNLILINNKLVSLTKSGRVKEAELLLPSLTPLKNDSQSAPLYHAARGIVAFQSDPEAGRNEYRHAVEIALKNRDRERSINAFMHWLEQEGRYGLVDVETLDAVDGLIARSFVSHGLRMIWRAISTPLRSALSAPAIPDDSSDKRPKLEFVSELIPSLTFSS